MAAEYDTVLDIFESGKLQQDELVSLYAAIGDTMYPDDEWRGDKPHHIIVGDRQYSMRFKGNRQLAVIARLRDWLRDELQQALDAAGLEDLSDKFDFQKGIKVLIAILDPQIFVGLGEVLLDEDEDFVTEHFDLEWIVGGAEAAYNANKFIQRVAKGFFTRLG